MKVVVNPENQRMVRVIAPKNRGKLISQREIFKITPVFLIRRQNKQSNKKEERAPFHLFKNFFGIGAVRKLTQTTPPRQ
jgi:hypothetical protein